MTAGLSSLFRRLWDMIAGPPRVRRLPDGTLHVRLIGRVHEAPDYDSLLSSVSRERERLLMMLGQIRERGDFASPRPPAEPSSYPVPYHVQRRVEDRLAIYNEFLGSLLDEMQRQAS